ncbi:hypothetical protein ACMBCN_01320 [Candidatus Liberibacter asiaticus]|nr:hypothetical protein [Candidatus Liberibacter asiaticus]
MPIHTRRLLIPRNQNPNPIHRLHSAIAAYPNPSCYCHHYSYPSWSSPLLKSFAHRFSLQILFIYLLLLLLLLKRKKTKTKKEKGKKKKREKNAFFLVITGSIPSDYSS